MDEYFTITQFSKLTGVTKRTLQFYDYHDILHPHHRNDSDYRFYSKNEMLILQKINILKSLGFSLNQIKDILKSNNFDWLSSFKLQIKVLEKDIEKLTDGIRLINHCINKHMTDQDEPDWETLSKILTVLQMKQDTAYQDWIKRNFSETDLQFFTEMISTQNSDKYARLWKNIFTEAKSLMHLPPSDPKVQKLAIAIMENANLQYKGNEGLKGKMWDLMKSGDIPEGFILGYEQDVILFLNQAMLIMYKAK